MQSPHTQSSEVEFKPQTWEKQGYEVTKIISMLFKKFKYYKYFWYTVAVASVVFSFVSVLTKPQTTPCLFPHFMVKG